MPSRTLSPRMSTIVTTTLSPMMMLSSRCRDKTSIANSFPILQHEILVVCGIYIGQRKRGYVNNLQNIRKHERDSLRTIRQFTLNYQLCLTGLIGGSIGGYCARTRQVPHLGINHPEPRYSRLEENHFGNLLLNNNLTPFVKKTRSNPTHRHDAC